MSARAHDDPPTLPPGALPAPIPGREGAIGGIESLTLDNRRYFFGFDYSSDLVVSPLIEDTEVMAAFASEHMRQRDGRHDTDYWRDLVLDAVDNSELSSDEGSRDFSTEDLRRIAAELEAARETESALEGFAIEYHLLYLLGAAAQWPALFDGDTEAQEALGRLDLDPEEGKQAISAAIAMLAGEEDLPLDGAYADCALVVARHLAALVNLAPVNWHTLFAPLAAGVD